MDPRPSNWLLLLLTGFMHFWQCARVQSTYIIDNVGLTIQPSSTVHTGTNVTLQCEVSISQDTSLLPMYHFQFTKNNVVINATNTREETVVYELNPARAADSGSYGCQVTVKEKSKTSVEKTLTVVGLQKPVLHLNKTSFFESEEVLARCSAPSEKGSFIFYFYQKFRNGDTKEIKRAMSLENSSEARLSLSHIGDSHLYCDYAISLVGRSNHSDEIQVFVKRMLINPVMDIQPSTQVYEGDTIKVGCKIENPPMRDVEVFLIKNKRILSKSNASLNHPLRVQEGDSGELVCKAKWNTLQKESYETITVKELISKPSLTVEPIDLFEGDHLKMTCSVDIYVPERIQNYTLKYFIYKDNKEVSRGTVYNTLAQLNNNGNYTCNVQASSRKSSFVKESKTLIVKAKVPVSKPTLSVLGNTVVLGKPFQLLCQSDKGTLPIEYTLNTSKRSSEVKMVTKPGERAIFNTTITKISELNNFFCQSKNHPKISPKTATGQELQASTKILEPVSKPILTTVPSLNDITERHDVTLYCSVFRGTAPVNFTWYRSENQVPLFSQPTDKHKAFFVIKDVKREHNGGYYCVSTNPANETKHSDTLTITVKMAGWKKALIVIVCLLLLVALILVIVFKKHLLRFKKKRTAELSVKSAGTKIERLSLTQAEVTNMANATPSMMGKSVWSEHVSGSESDYENGVTAPKTPELEYAEVQTKQVDPNRAPVKKGTDTTYSEVRHSRQGVPELADSQASVEYAELNHDAEPQSGSSNHDDHTAQDDHKSETENCAVVNNAGQGE